MTHPVLGGFLIGIVYQCSCQLVNHRHDFFFGIASVMDQSARPETSHVSFVGSGKHKERVLKGTQKVHDKNRWKVRLVFITFVEKSG